MAGQGSGVEVDPDELLSIADAIADLLDDVKGSTGATGNLPDFQTNAAPSQMLTAWASLFPEDAGNMGDYKVAVYFFSCDGTFNCTSIQFETPFEKDPSFTLSRINSYNARQRFSRLYINPDDGSLALDYDVLVDGVTVGSIKKSIALFDNIVGDFRTFVNQ